MNATIDRHESAVRGYCRSFTATIDRAEGAWLTDIEGRRYLDFLAGAGALNYGHNPEPLKRRLLEYIERGGISHGLDLYTDAKETFLERLHELVLAPRGMDYRVQFPGPTGTNAVEAALKLARKVTGREGVVFFTNGFHGMTLGTLAVTGNAGKRAGAGQALHNATPMPFDGYLGPDVDTLDYFERVLADGGSGVDRPAAVVLETVQAEGGINVASDAWLQRLAALCRRHDILLIIDDIQVGCGRTGPFFSFETAGIAPDLVCLSKSLSGYGQPLSLVLIRPELDQWQPGEHNGTFRGNNLAFVTATAALETWWRDDTLTREVARKGAWVEQRLQRIADDVPGLEPAVRGRGFIQGLACGDAPAAAAIAQRCYRQGLIIETCGIDDQVLKFLAPLTISDADLVWGLDVVAAAALDVAHERRTRRVA